MSATKQTAGRWAGRLAIASMALLAGCSAGLSAHPSVQFVEDGAHPERLTAPPLATTTTLPPTTTTIPRKRIPTTTTTPPPPPRTTPPTSPPTTEPVVIPATTTTVAPTPQISAPQPAIGDPSVSMAPDPNFYGVCPDNSLVLSGACEEEALQAIDHARASEGLGPMELPPDWSGLTPAEQLFVATDLERTVRGLAPFEGMATTLEPAAQAAADSDSDPEPPGGFPTDQWTSNSGAGYANPLETLYVWMYDDGAGSPNVDCVPGNTSGCWGHRQDILASFPCTPCVVGSADTPSASWAELMTETTGAPELTFAWSSVG
jgi:hypothetical protein